MATNLDRILRFVEYMRSLRPDGDLRNELRPDTATPLVRLPKGGSPDDIDARWNALGASAEARQELSDPERAPHYKKNIENYIGTVKVPVGIAGPLRVHGMFAKGDFYVPLATTEAALIASYSRGSQVISEAGGCSAALLNEGVTRAPGFVFETLADAIAFTRWVATEKQTLTEVAESTTRFGKLADLDISVDANQVFLRLEFFSSDASGQNMATIATQAVCDHVRNHSPVPPRAAYVEANFSGDKKASSQAFQSVRGRKASAEVILPRDLCEKRLNATPEDIAQYFRLSVIGCVQSGTVGTGGHYANGLAALYLATGQDVACVAESAVGITRFEVRSSGDLHASVTLPSLMVATVGGGTNLPSQHACLEVLGLVGQGKAHAFAEVAAALCLAGEISIAAALSAGEFTRAHRTLARGKAPSPGPLRTDSDSSAEDPA